MRHAWLLLLLAAVACSTTAPPDGGGGSGPAGGSGGSAGSGGRGGSNPCFDPDRDNDGSRAQECGGADCDDGDPSVFEGATEVCGDGIDQDCSGAADNGCQCTPGDRRACWDASATTRHVGICTDGQQVCSRQGRWSECAGEIEAESSDPPCDGRDADCDGADGRCHDCPPGAVEICGNGLDDDCRGTFDDPDVCRFSCRDADLTRSTFACCLDPELPAFSHECVEAPQMPACSLRPCLDLDGDPLTACAKVCIPDGPCFCGAPGDPPRASAGCGFQTPCGRMDCDDRVDQPCYSGPPGTLGVGACRGGRTSCLEVEGQRRWDLCRDQVLPSNEVCGNGIDDDCDGGIDEEDGTTHRRCPVRSDCFDEELCDNGLDDDCDGFVDETCSPGANQQRCYTGPPDTSGVGRCHPGIQVRQDGVWGACSGETTPGPERCFDGEDSGCDGRGGFGRAEDTGCCVPSGDEVCNGKDDDCDGLVDEQVLSRCGRCDDAPCFEETFAPLAGCSGDGRSCAHIAAAEGGGITLAAPETFEPASHLVVVRSGPTVELLDLATGVTRNTLWGTSAAVAAVDGTFWVLQSGSTLLHLSSTFGSLCSVNVSGILSFGVGSDGDVYVLKAQQLLRVDGSASDGGSCRWKDLDPTQPGDALAVPVSQGPVVPSGRGLVWMVGLSGTAARYDTLTGELVSVATTAVPRDSGVGELDGGVWVDGELLHLDGDGPYDLPDLPHERRVGVTLRGLTPDASGGLWGHDTSKAVRFDPATGGVREVSFGSNSTEVVYTSDAGGVYASQRDSRPSDLGLFRLDGDAWTRLTGGRFSLTQYAPSAAMNRRRAFELASGRGLWSQVVEGHSPLASWHRLTWTEERSAGQRVVAIVHLAGSVEALATPALRCFAEGGELDLSACTGGARYRAARVELHLFAGQDGSSPVVRDVTLAWTRP